MGMESVLGALRLGQFSDGKALADRQRESRLPEQTAAQLDRLVLFFLGLLERLMPQAEDEPVADGPLGTVGPPDGAGHELDRGDLGGVARLEVVDKLLLPGRKLTGILPGQQHGPGGQAVRGGVVFRMVFPREQCARPVLFCAFRWLISAPLGLAFGFGFSAETSSCPSRVWWQAWPFFPPFVAVPDVVGTARTQMDPD